MWRTCSKDVTFVINSENKQVLRARQTMNSYSQNAGFLIQTINSTIFKSSTLTLFSLKNEVDHNFYHLNYKKIVDK